MHEIVDRSVQLVARICECSKRLNNVPYVIRSCIKMHATRESWIAYRGWIIRATSCTLHSKWITLLTVDNMLFEKTHAKITALYFVPCVVHSCNKLHATRELVNRVPWLNLSCYEGIANHVSEFIIRATSCTLRGNPESRIGVELFVHRDARYEGIVNHVSRLIHSCNKLHATRES